MATVKMVEAGSPQQGQPRGLTPLDTSMVSHAIGRSIDQVREEVDDAFAAMKTFLNREPDEILRLSSGYSARLSELSVKIQRIEDFQREWRNIRVREIEPAIVELERQLRTASRLHSIRELDWKMENGER